jgi:hypothetical protein
MTTALMMLMLVILFFAFIGFKVVGLVWDTVIEPFLGFVFMMCVLLAIFL